MFLLLEKQRWVIAPPTFPSSFQVGPHEVTYVHGDTETLWQELVCERITDPQQQEASQSHGPMGRLFILSAPELSLGLNPRQFYGKSGLPVKAKEPLIWTLAKWPSGSHKVRGGREGLGAAANPCLTGQW